MNNAKCIGIACFLMDFGSSDGQRVALCCAPRGFAGGCERSVCAPCSGFSRVSGQGSSWYRQVSCALSDRWVARRPVRLLVQQRHVQVAARPPHSLSATYLSLAVTSISALLPSGKVPTTLVRFLNLRFSCSIALLERIWRQCSWGACT